jgi:hypothetical protein
MTRCSLSAQTGVREPCSSDACAFWQEGGDDLGAGCAVERLELDCGGIDVADFLLGLRGRLESAALHG